MGFPASADVILYPISCLLDMARRRVNNGVYLTCIIRSKPGLSSFLPVTHFVLCCLPFLCFYSFIFTVFHWAPLFDQTSVKPLFIIFWGSRSAASLPMLSKSVVGCFFFLSRLRILTSYPSHGSIMFSFGSRKMLSEYHRWVWSVQSLLTLIKEGETAIIQSCSSAAHNNGCLRLSPLLLHLVFL